MEHALLILVLSAGDPASGVAAKAVAEALRTQRAETRLVLPPDSLKQLQARGVGDGDLIGRSEKPILATAKEIGLVVVRVERRETGTDRVIDVELWAGGRHDLTTAVSGADGDPTPAASENACRLLRQAALDPAAVAERAELALIASYAERADWNGLVAAVAQRADASPRLHGASINARLRLGDRVGATAELERLRAQAPDSPQVREAAATIAADAGGADALRDPVRESGDGNILH